MNKADVRKLVERWLDERVEIDGDVNVPPGKGDDAFQAMLASIAKPDSESVMKTNDGWDDFFEWLREQEDRGGPVYAPEWSSAMKQRGFRLEQVGNDWFFHGLKLKEE